MASSSLLLAAIQQLENGIKFKKCHRCGCQHGTVLAIEKNLPSFPKEDQEILRPLLDRAKATFVPAAYDCLGCKVCFPSIATNALTEAYPKIVLESDGCGGEEKLEMRSEWPPYAGNYEVLRVEAPVAICTLNSKDLVQSLVSSQHPSISIVGTMNTENLGIERVIHNVISNSNIRFLIICGEDSKQKIGHLPGQSLRSLFENGVDPSTRTIRGAPGKRPVLKNITEEMIERFMKQVKLIDLNGTTNPQSILKQVNICASRNPGSYEGDFVMQHSTEKIIAKMPPPLRLDPNGYFVIYPNASRGIISVEHYLKSGVLNKVVEGEDIASIYMTCLELELLSQLDHACYLGKELARAEISLKMGGPYVQDKAQEGPSTSPLSAEKKSPCGSNDCC